ncbi:transmembrane 7 superfamily member 3 [Otolemur garnettii]|uniref:transmembrane 7 superfamily member 3 n=1 Tax=Otolemur garnettii TaxID=30611 RepID=UPI000C7F2503|nr:transmembrane 7 superfamily member 3 [Otolemur garnettii]
MGLLRLLVLAVLASERGVAVGTEAFGNSSEGLLEFSLGKFRYLKLSKPFPVEAVLHHISSNVTFLVFQIHSQYQNTTVSFSRTLLPNASETGTDRGLVFILRPEQSVCTWYLETFDAEPVQNVAILLSYSEKVLLFDFRGTDPPPCDVGTGRDSRWRLQYDVYQYFLPENDLTEEVLLKHLQRMVQVSQVKANAVKVATLRADDKTSVSFSSLPGQGAIYNVIVWDPFLNTSAAYVPVHTYACSFKDVEGNCASLAFLVVCYLELFFIGFIFMGFFFYILITRLTLLKYDVRLTLTAAAGSVGGILLVAAWWRFGILTLCMLCVGLVLGFFVSSVTFFTPLGNVKVFHDDGVFWVTFSGIAILIPIVFVGCLRILNILTCGVIGSYSVVLAVHSYLYTSLSYITLNILRRALNEEFLSVFSNVPFQTNDFIILAVWGMLAVSGITFQIRRERGQPFFPPHPYKLWKQERARRVTNILDPSYHIPPLRERLYGRLAQVKELFRKEQPAGERTPLLL